MQPTYEQFDRETEAEMFRRFHEDGDMEARRLLIESQMPLIKMLVNRYCERVPRWDHDEVLSLGYEAAIVAVDRFQTERGCRLCTFTGWVFRSFAGRGMIHGPIHLPVYSRRTEVMAKLRAVVSLSDGTNSCLCVAPQDPEFDSDVFDRVLRIVEQMPHRWQHVIRRLFLERAKVYVVAAELQISTTRVGQLRDAALHRIREVLRLGPEGADMDLAPMVDRIAKPGAGRRKKVAKMLGHPCFLEILPQR